MVKLMHFNFVYSFLFQLLVTVRCVIAQLLFDADKLVVLSRNLRGRRILRHGCRRRSPGRSYLRHRIS